MDEIFFGGGTKKEEKSKRKEITWPFTIRIYKLWQDEEHGIFYIGSTSQTVDKRAYQHLRYTKKGSELGVNKWLREHNLDVLYREIDKKWLVLGKKEII